MDVKELRFSDKAETLDVAEILHNKRIHSKVSVGYDLYKDDKGISQLGEVVLGPEPNKVTLGGILHILKVLFGVDSDLEISTVNQLLGIGLAGAPNLDEKKLVFGFDVGIGGCGASYAEVKEVLDQQNIVPGIIPIRIVDSEDELGEAKDKYWFKKPMEDGKMAYYLKTFESEPVVHSLWKDAIDDDADGNPVVGNPSGSTRTEGIESFAEIVLRISAQDLREYFELNEPTGTKYARFNSLGLCVGIKGTITDGDRAGETEFLNTVQFSIINFSNEILHFDKDLHVIYRIYIS